MPERWDLQAFLRFDRRQKLKGHAITIGYRYGKAAHFNRGRVSKPLAEDVSDFLQRIRWLRRLQGRFIDYEQRVDIAKAVYIGMLSDGTAEQRVDRALQGSLERYFDGIQSLRDLFHVARVCTGEKVAQ